MGILTCQQGELFVITSDCITGEPSSKRAPARFSKAFEVWTGQRWSATQGDAISFSSLNAADEYVRVNYPQLASGN